MFQKSICVVKIYAGHAGHGSEFIERDGGSGERNGFMVEVWWEGLEQQEYEVAY